MYILLMVMYMFILCNRANALFYIRIYVYVFWRLKQKRCLDRR